MAYTYILRCIDGSYYTGSTKNLEQRLWQHKAGQGANYTKVRSPVELVYTEYYERVDEAFSREKQIQKWSRKKKEALIEGNFEKLHSLSKSHFDRLSDRFDRLSDRIDRLSDRIDKLREQTDRSLCFDMTQQPSLSKDRSLSLSKGKL